MKHLLNSSFFAMLLLSIAACAPQGAREGQARKASDINMQLGSAYMRQGDNLRAMEKMKRAVKQDPSNANAHSTIALLYARLRLYDEANDHFEKALKLDPVSSRIRFNYGTYLCSVGKFKQAEQEFLTVVSNPLYQTPEYAYTNAGTCLKRASDLVKAEQYLRKALTINPVFPAALLGMARLSFEKKRYLSVRAYLQRYTGVTRYNAASLWLSIRAEKILGDKNKVASQSLLLKAKFPDSEETRLLLEMEEK